MRVSAFAGICFCVFGLSGAVPQRARRPETYGPPVTLATIKDKSITENSGLVASRSTPGAYWTHNDSGGGPFIYAFGTNGESLGVFRVTGAQNLDWEDISIGPGPQSNQSYLYVGDIGDNDSNRAEVMVYRVAEPVLTTFSRNLTKSRPGLTEPAQAIRLRYPDGGHDAEALLVHPATGNIFIVIKVVIANPVVYQATAPFETGKPVTLKRIGEVRVPSLFGGVITGGSISPDGRRVALCDYFQGYELVLPDNATDFNDIWTQRMTGFDLGKRKQGEGITYRLDGKALLATSEGRNAPLIQVTRN